MKDSIEKITLLKYGIFPAMLFCTLTLLIDVWSIYNVIRGNLLKTATWWVIPLSVGVFFWAGWRAKLKYEKITCYIFGISFFLKYITQFVKKEMAMELVIIYLVLDIYATLNFWTGYRKSFHNKMTNHRRLREYLNRLKIPLIVLAGFITAILFVWLSHVM